MTRRASGAPTDPWPEGFEVDRDPDADDVAVLEERVIAATRAVSGVDDDRELGIVLRDPAGAVRAGICGITWGGCCELQYLWVDASLARRGIGSALLAAAEEEARRRACRQVVFLTHDVQTTGFYEQFGYRTVGTVDDYPTGSRARWFRKGLSASVEDPS
jgi:GNAT superfamily N-acetyltransferase